MSILIKTKLPNIGNRSPHLLGWWKMQEGEGNVLYDSSGRGNHLVSGLPAGFTSGFWATDGVASFNSDVADDSDCAILARNNSTVANIADYRGQLGMHDANSKPPSIIVVRRYTPIRDEEVFTDGWWWSDADGTVDKLGWQTQRTNVSYADGSRHQGFFQNTVNSVVGNQAATWLTAMTDRFGAGNELDMGVERYDFLLCNKTASASGTLDYYINNNPAFNTETLPAAFGDEVLASRSANGFCFSIGSRGPRVDTGKGAGMRLRDFQLYVSYKDVPTDIITALQGLSLFETLTRDDWS